jgi:hypothetical protein
VRTIFRRDNQGLLMTAASYDAGKEFSIGNVFSRAWQLFTANFIFFFIVTLIVALPNLLVATNPDPSSFGWGFAIAIILGVLLNTVGQAVLLYAAFQYLRGHTVQPGEALQLGLSRFLPLLGLAILYGLGLALGLVLLVVPFFFLLVMWAVVVPACVVEGLGPIASMSRSTQLTKGHRWKIFGIIFLLLIVSVIGNKLIPLILVPAGLVVLSLGLVIWTAIWAAYWNCVLIMTYHDLRVAKEGVDTAQIASVFD